MFRKNTPRYQAENFPNILALVDLLKKVGVKRGATSAQVALAWILAQGPDFIPIPGTSKIPVCVFFCRILEKDSCIAYRLSRRM